MPSNKNASYRYRLIDHYLCNRGKRWTMDTLLQEINERLYQEFDHDNGVTLRTLEDDFRIMRKDWPEGFGAPIKRRKGKVFYEDPNYSIRKTPLIEKDITALQEALGLLQQFTELPHFEELKEVVIKLKGHLSKNKVDERPIIQFERNHHLKGINFIRRLYRTIAEQQPIRLTYRPFHEEEPRILVVHPHLLKEYNNRWFLLALPQDEKIIWNFALDRIVSFEVIDLPFLMSPVFDAHTYFKSIVGVTIPENGQLENIRLKVAKSRAPYLETKPLHTSQKIEDRLVGGEVIFSLKLIPNFEFKAALLSFGADVEVLVPQNLRTELQEIIEKADQFYKAV